MSRQVSEMRQRGVKVEVLQGLHCVELKRLFIQSHPDLWKESIGPDDSSGRW
jgi:hypothetical protein